MVVAENYGKLCVIDCWRGGGYIGGSANRWFEIPIPNAAIQAAFATGAYTMAQLAQHFQVHYTSVSLIVKLI